MLETKLSFHFLHFLYDEYCNCNYLNDLHIFRCMNLYQRSLVAIVGLININSVDIPQIIVMLFVCFI